MPSSSGVEGPIGVSGDQPGPKVTEASLDAAWRFRNPCPRAAIEGVFGRRLIRRRRTTVKGWDDLPALFNSVVPSAVLSDLARDERQALSSLAHLSSCGFACRARRVEEAKRRRKQTVAYHQVGRRRGRAGGRRRGGPR